MKYLRKQFGMALVLISFNSYAMDSTSSNFYIPNNQVKIKNNLSIHESVSNMAQTDTWTDFYLESDSNKLAKPGFIFSNTPFLSMNLLEELWYEFEDIFVTQEKSENIISFLEFMEMLEADYLNVAHFLEPYENEFIGMLMFGDQDIFMNSNAAVANFPMVPSLTMLKNLGGAILFIVIITKIINELTKMTTNTATRIIIDGDDAEQIARIGASGLAKVFGKGGFIGGTLEEGAQRKITAALDKVAPRGADGRRGEIEIGPDQVDPREALRSGARGVSRLADTVRRLRRPQEDKDSNGGNNNQGNRKK